MTYYDICLSKKCISFPAFQTDLQDLPDGLGRCSSATPGLDQALAARAIASFVRVMREADMPGAVMPMLELLGKLVLDGSGWHWCNCLSLAFQHK